MQTFAKALQLKSYFKFSCVVLMLHLSLCGFAQEHQQQYFPPTDSLVVRKLEKWQDYKFGLLMHWGPYSQWGVVESWSICPEDEDWCRRRGPYANDYFAYRKAYEQLQLTFNPTEFNPVQWAAAARKGGMKYMVFTTKHHDGFCMFETATTDYKITSPRTPFSKNARANITKEVFDAFRNEGMMVGAYFSKPDWHSNDYWDKTWPPLDRNPNYDINKYPEKWKRFMQHTYSQLGELMDVYGRVDILWLDGGWVQPMTETSPRWGTRPMHQDIRMDSLAEILRIKQPGLIVVDRAVEGPNQNYLTPEQHVPGKLLPYPWETCMTMATSWSYVPNDTYKSSAELVRTLCTVVARGGNLLLNIAPSPQGTWDSTAYVRLNDIGTWLRSNGEAIYDTRPLVPYEVNRNGTTWVFTQNKNGKRFAIDLNGNSNPQQARTNLKTSGFSIKKELKSAPGMPKVYQVVAVR
ncbi:MAG: alpha-L-fucosidase [Bacteroidota bacterium]